MSISSKRKIERCGYCGQYVVDGRDYGSPDGLTDEETNNYTTGHCSNAQQEHYEQNPDDFN